MDVGLSHLVKCCTGFTNAPIFKGIFTAYFWIFRLSYILLYSNWTFIVLNLQFMKETLRCNSTNKVYQFQYPGSEKKSSNTENARG